MPRVSAEVVNVAWPLTSTLAEPSSVAPSRKLTVPVGEAAVAAAPLLMVAVNVIDCPTLDGLADDASKVVVDACVTD